MEKNINKKFRITKKSSGFSGVDGNRGMKNKWDEVAELLNSAGGAHKDGEKWKRLWSDLRLNVKYIAAEMKNVANTSGVNVFSRQKKTLNDIEERITFMSWNSTVGDQIIAPESVLPKNLSYLNKYPRPSTSTANATEIMIEPTESK